MPRIRNWKDLKLFRPCKGEIYEHIDELFSGEIDWELIETHYPDMIRVAMSIQAGKITPSTILNKLGTHSKKNKVTIQAATNKIEAFNGFTKLIFFGGERIIAENDREKQRKVIKYNHLVANCLIFYNVFSLSRILDDYMQDGNEYDEEIISCLSPYVTVHVNRFGKYCIDLNRKPPNLPFEVPVTREKRISLTK